MPAPSAPPASSFKPQNRRRLRRVLGEDRLRENVDLTPFTTFKIGGPADLFYEARTADELCRAVRPSATPWRGPSFGFAVKRALPSASSKPAPPPCLPSLPAWAPRS